MAVTIDQIGVKAHKRWAEDQKILDRRYIADASNIPDHSEIAGISSIYASQLGLLLEFEETTHPFANFSAPPEYERQRNRFFGIQLTPSFKWWNHEEEEADRFKKRIRRKKPAGLPKSLEERDVEHLDALFDSMQLLQEFLSDISARKAQYQKG